MQNEFFSKPNSWAHPQTGTELRRPPPDYSGRPGAALLYSGKWGPEDAGRWLANCHMFFSLILAWSAEALGKCCYRCWSLALWSLSGWWMGTILKVRQPCLSEACQCTFICKTCWADSTKSLASPSGKGCWKWGKIEGGVGLSLPEKKLFDLLSLTSVNSQGNFSWCHLNYLLCKEKKKTAGRGNNLFALSIDYYFFLSRNSSDSQSILCNHLLSPKDEFCEIHAFLSPQKMC